jgi:hypothetical protein
MLQTLSGALTSSLKHCRHKYKNLAKHVDKITASHFTSFEIFTAM